MTDWRIIQRGAAPGPLVLVYHLNERANDALRLAAPTATIANDTVHGSMYQDAETIDKSIAEIGGGPYAPVVLAGFSAGGLATRRVLEQGSDPDALVIADGTYAMSESQMAAWKAYAAKARAGQRVMLASHSAYSAPNNTWHVLQEIAGVPLPLNGENRFQDGNLIILSSPTAHNYHGEVLLPRMVGEALTMLGAQKPAPEKKPAPWVAALGILAAAGAAAIIIRR
jgi:hypothetical protein